MGLLVGTKRALLAGYPATRYYVDATLGNDANDGKTPDSALQTIAGANALTLKPGEIVLLKRGETWNGEKLTPPSSGAAGRDIRFSPYGSGAAPIITAVNTISGAWTLLAGEYWTSLATAPTTVFADGTQLDAGIIGALALGEYGYDGVADRLYVRLAGDANPAGSTVQWCTLSASIDVNNVDYITIDGLAVGAPFVAVEGYGVFIQGTSANTIVRNCTISGDLDVRTIGLQAESGPVTIYNNDISLLETGLRLESNVGFSGRVYENTIYNINKGDVQEQDGIALSKNGDFSGMTVSYNTIYNYGEDGVDNFANNIIIEKNLVRNPLAVAIPVTGIKCSAGTSGVVIRYNECRDIDDGDKGIGIIVGGSNNEIYYNLVTNPFQDGITIWGGLGIATGNEVYNNTIYDAGRYGISVLSGANNASATVENNICDGSGGDIRSDGNGAGSATITGDYNCLANDAAAIEINGGTYNPGTNDLGATNPLWTNPGGDDFTLQAGSLCRNVGDDVGLTEDYDGVSVPQETNPAIGAYEYVA